ncbi:MAG: class I SAM-dependent methyltransferase [Myxococcales bacterium]|nr:MAG: class I SAM-dependent methyltransferase [Myxococcales bacterium]
MEPHARLYSAAALYDLAFSYRDVGAQCSFLRDTFHALRGRHARSFLELAAGPARHALEMSRSGLASTALDRSPEMAALARGRAAAAGLELTYVVSDMTRFHAPSRVELAACLLSSTSYLLTDEAMLAHLEAARAALHEDGLYWLELTHPVELEGTRKSQTRWTMADGRGRVLVDWQGDPARARHGIWQTRVLLRYEPSDGGPPIEIEDVAEQRALTERQARELAARSGWRVEATFGDFDANVGLDDARATRMLLALTPSS